MLNKKEKYLILDDISDPKSGSDWTGIKSQSRVVQLSNDRGKWFYNRPILKSTGSNDGDGMGNKLILNTAKIILAFLAVLGSVFFLDTRIKKA